MKKAKTRIIFGKIEYAPILWILMKESFSPAPWSQDGLYQILALPSVLSLIALQHNSLDEEVPKGFIIAQQIATAGEAEILSIAVHPSAQRQGIGQLLLGYLFQELQRQKINSVFLEVAVDNIVAQTLYKKNGFQITGRRPGYYPRASGPAIDALLLRRELEK